VRGAAGEERASVGGVGGEAGRGQGERALGEREHVAVVRPAARVLLDPPLQGQGLEIGQHGVLGTLPGESGEAGLGRVELAVVDEAESLPGGRVPRARQVDRTWERDRHGQDHQTVHDGMHRPFMRAAFPSS
jgi:hypothetical protein